MAAACLTARRQARLGIVLLRAALSRAALLCALAVLCAMAVLCFPTRGALAQQPDVVQIQSMQLRREGNQLNLRFQLSGPTRAEVSGNLPRRVVAVKFNNAIPAFAAAQRQFAFNDPLLIGIAFDELSESGTWAKLRLRTPYLSYELLENGENGVVVLGLRPGEAPEGAVLTGVRVGEHESGSRVVLDLTIVPKYEDTLQGNKYLVRLVGVTPRLTTSGAEEDPNLLLEGVTKDGADTLLSFQLKGGDLGVSAFPLQNPARLVFDFQPGKPRAASRPVDEAPAEGKREAFIEIPLDQLLDQVGRPLITANYLTADQELRLGNYERAARLFIRVFDSVPDTPLGVRAYIHAGDAMYEQKVAEGARNYHDVITVYQSAINRADAIGYETEFIARANFQIGRSYQRMGFYFESNVHYQILQERFPDNPAYTPDSFYYQGLNFLEQTHYEQAVAAFETFLSSGGAPELQGRAHYLLGDALFNLQRFVLAKQAFDRAGKLDKTFHLDRPLLLFHMGETYYENAEFDLARILYRLLIERYPDKSYSKLVGLRLGDFLREEGREQEALDVYRRVVKGAPDEIRMRGKLRIANLLSERPLGEQLDEALVLYDEVTADGEGRLVTQEAMLRKAIALTLHQRNQEAIITLEGLAANFPKGPYTRDNLIRDNIEENLKVLIDRLHRDKKHWEVARIYTRYRDAYLHRFRFPYTLLQVAGSYQALGLYDDAVVLYDQLLKRDLGELASLAEYQKGLALLEKDDLGAAEASLLQFIQGHEKDVYLTDARMLLGRVYTIGRRYEEALSAYRILVQDFEKSRDPELGEAMAETHFELGRIYRELGRNKEALDAFEASVANFHHPIAGEGVPEFVILSHFRAADMMYELGQDREALQAYQGAINLYTDHERAPWAQYQMGLIYRRQGEDSKALDVFNALVELAKIKPGELWEPLARGSQRDLTNKLGYRNYLKQ